MAPHSVRHTTTCQKNLFDRLDNDMPEQECLFCTNDVTAKNALMSQNSFLACCKVRYMSILKSNNKNC